VIVDFIFFVEEGRIPEHNSGETMPVLLKHVFNKALRHRRYFEQPGGAVADDLDAIVNSDICQ